MSDEAMTTDEIGAEWGDEGGAPPKKKGGIPKWVWIGCGGGCLLALIAIAALGIFAFSVGKKFTDPEYAWEQLETLLPYDERPAGYTPLGGGFFKTENYVIKADGSQLFAILMRLPGSSEFDDVFDPDSMSNRGVMGFGEITDAEHGTIELQGRETRCMRFNAWVPESAKEEGYEGASIRVDLKGEGANYVLIQFTLSGDGERVEDEDVIAFLEPFDVWRDR